MEVIWVCASSTCWRKYWSSGWVHPCTRDWSAFLCSYHCSSSCWVGTSLTFWGADSEPDPWLDLDEDFLPVEAVSVASLLFRLRPLDELLPDAGGDEAAGAGAAGMPLSL